ncbi:hypothetical protein PF005_g9883 [Phytophthora fragariae]|uniref:Uncharacterized protein n=2 Tax=Phytophthora TaxID=4783 RepID=A0A6A4A1N5_9STRA|nr:hypothetical protein PF003_g29432 [Phytophthora fragariae]KAE9036805.1 hypothetical protein PR001_g8658 [Phytophthora rubi]KAE8944966.1 hypothetical protein PF009_g5370 [Phytophthora fragariae]KAE9028722.1 hypothetical protein PF011_g1437 [Phytophthora fragariae]KAE9039707.1 hypothetical protein PR002_g5347 [Phytophthora rubi]
MMLLLWSLHFEHCWVGKLQRVSFDVKVRKCCDKRKLNYLSIAKSKNEYIYSSTKLRIVVFTQICRTWREIGRNLNRFQPVLTNQRWRMSRGLRHTNEMCATSDSELELVVDW